MTKLGHNPYTYAVGQPITSPAIHVAEAVGAFARERLPVTTAPQPLHVLLVTARYLPSTGGTEIHTYEVARRLVAEGHHATVLTTDPQGTKLGVERSEGIEVVRVKAWPTQRDYFFAPEIYTIIKRGQWDLIHCQGYHTFVAPIAMLAARAAGIPYVVTFHSGGHSSPIRKVARPFQRILLRPLLAGAERLIGVSTFEAEFFRERLRLPADRFMVIPNGSSLPVADNAGVVNRQGQLIVSVGRLERYKGHHRVIAALPKIMREYPDVHLRIIGSGPYESTLRRLAHEHGVADRVEICSVPASDRQAMSNLISSASLMILLSDYESQAMAVMEALALGRPVLVANTSALHELAEKGLVRATALGGTTDEIAAAIMRQLHSPLIPTDVSLPTWEGCFDALSSLYQTISRRS